MKKFITIVLAAIILGTLSCEKEEVPIYFPGDMEFGSLQGKKNGKEWEASSTAFRSSTFPNLYFGLLSATYSEEGFLRESIDFGEIPFLIGKFEVSKTTSHIGDGFIGAFYGTSSADGDAGEDSYKLDEEADNWLEVTFFDTLANVAQGRFDVTFRINGEKENPANPDKVRFSEGVFDVKLKE